MDGTELGSLTPAQASAHNIHLQAHQAAMQHVLATQQQQPNLTSPVGVPFHTNPNYVQEMQRLLQHGTPVKAVIATASVVPASAAGVHAASTPTLAKHVPAPNHQHTHSTHTHNTHAPIHHQPGSLGPLGIVGIPIGTHSNGGNGTTNSNGNNGHSAVVQPVSATAIPPPSTNNSAHPPSSASNSLHPPSTGTSLARRPSPAGVVMATVLDASSAPTTARAAPVLSHSSSGNNSHPPPTGVPIATREPSARHRSPMPKASQIVQATLLDDSMARTHPHAARPAKAKEGQIVVTARIIPAVQARALAARVAPANGYAASTSRRDRSRRKRPLKGGGRAKLHAPDPLDELDEGGSITRCICGSSEDDGFMICCEGCSAWQHGECIGVDPDHVPEEYYCDLCDPEGEIHLARTEAMDQEHKRKRRKRSHGGLALGKKRGRRQSNSSRGAGRNEDYDSASFSDEDSGEDRSRSGSRSRSTSPRSGADGEQDSQTGVDQDGDSTMQSSDGMQSPRYASSSQQQHQRRGARNLKPLHLDRSSSTTGTGSQGHPSAGTDKDDASMVSPSQSQFTSPVFSSNSSHPTAIMSPASAAAVVAAGGVVGSGTIIGIGGASVTTSADVTPQASPTGETKLRSLIFTMEQLANGQMTSPVSTSAGVSLAQLAQYQTKFTYPVPGVSPPGVQPVSASSSPVPGAVDPSSVGVVIKQEQPKPNEVLSPLNLHRQISENTATAAMTVAGISAVNNNPQAVSHVKLEVFSPVLPPAMLSGPTAADFTVIPISNPEDHLFHRQQQRKYEQTLTSAVAPQDLAPSPQPPSSSFPVTTGHPMVTCSTPTSAQLSNPGLMSPNTHSIVTTLTNISPPPPSTGIISPTR